MYQATERICLNADKSAIVPCGSPAATFVLAGVGTEISAEDAARYGLTPPAGVTPRLAEEIEANRPAGLPITVTLDPEADADVLELLRQKRMTAASAP